MTDRYISDLGGSIAQTGLGDWDHAYPWSSLATLISAASNGDRVLVEAGVKLAPPASNVSLSKRLIWEGWYPDGTEGYALIWGDRTWPWPANGVWANTDTNTDTDQYVPASEGRNWLLLKTAGSGSTFTRFAFKHLKFPVQAALNAAADTATIEFHDCKSHNVSGGGFYTPGNSNGIVSVLCDNVRVHHYSVSGGARCWGDITITDSFFDARKQFHNPGTFPHGFHGHDFVLGVQTEASTATITRVASLNNSPVIPADAIDHGNLPDYAQGDGGVLEDSYVGSTVTDYYAKGNADRDLDLKCPCAVTRMYSEGSGFGISQHGNRGAAHVMYSYFGTPRRENAEADAVSCIQCSGTALVEHSVFDVQPGDDSAPASHARFYLARGEVNTAGTQSSQITPTRIGDMTLVNCRGSIASDVTESLTATGTEPGRFSALLGLTAAASHSFTIKGVNAAGTEGAAGAAQQVKPPVLYVTTGNITLSGLGTQSKGPWTSSLTDGDRILVRLQTSSPANGIYVAHSGSWTRAADADTAAEVTNAYVCVKFPANTSAYNQANTITTIGTDAQPWAAAGSTATAVYAGGDTTAPGAPGQPTASNITTTSADLVWTAATDNVDVAGYAIFLDGIVAGYTEALHFKLTSLVPGTTYSVQIAAWDNQNNLGTLSAARSVSTTSGSPSNPTVGAGVKPAVDDYGPTWITLTWAAITNAVAYHVYDNGVLIGQTFTNSSLATSYTKTRTTVTTV